MVLIACSLSGLISLAREPSSVGVSNSMKMNIIKQWTSLTLYT